jgi:O-antigen ligase
MLFHGISLPVDVTLGLAMFLLLDISWRTVLLFRGEKIQRTNLYAFFVLILFFIWMVFSLTYTPSPSYSRSKLVFFVTNIVAFAYPLFHKKIELRKFLRSFILLVLALTLWFIPILVYYFQHPAVHGNFGVLNEIAGMYLDIGFVEGLSIIILIQAPSLFKNTYRYIILLVLFLGLVFTGARGPLLITVVLSLIFYGFRFISIFYKNKSAKLMKFYKGILLSIMTLVFVFVLALSFPSQVKLLTNRTISRISLLFDTSDKGKSVNKRVTQIEYSTKMIVASPETFLLGYGIGSYGIMESGKDGRAYPHNVVLEILFELGFIGLFIFVVFLILVFSNHSDKFKYITSIVFFYFLINYMKSSSIVDMRICFGFLALYLCQMNSQILSQNNIN